MPMDERTWDPAGDGARDAAGDGSPATSTPTDDLLGDLAEPLTLTVPTDDAGVARRVKAIAATRPLHDLDRNKTAWEGDFWDRYDLLSLAISVIDQVALSMGISAGMLHDDAVAYVVDQARRQQPDAPTGEGEMVAARVVGGLIADAPHELVWADHTGSAPVRRTHAYRLLYEQWNADGSVHLRATEQAINVLVDALDLDDLESAQVAAETQIRALIDRGAFRSAVTIARQARYRTIQYLERIRNIVRDTLIDPDAYDWAGEVPKLLADALDHVVGRIEAESALMQAVEDRRAAATDLAARRTANQLTAMLLECRSRHLDLQRHLLGARPRLRRAQDEQFARGNASVRRAALEADLIDPLLRAPGASVAGLGEDLLVRYAAPHQAFLPTGAVLVDELLAPAREPAAGVEVPNPVFDEADPTPWWEPYWNAADAVLAAITVPTRLSAILAQVVDIAAATAGTDGEPLDEAVLSAALCHVAHEHTAIPLVGYDTLTPVLCGIVTGERLDHPFIACDDLQLVAAVAAPRSQPSLEDEVSAPPRVHTGGARP
jgi:hypothetical protein